MTALVRPATVDDLDACVELFAQVVEEGRWLGAEAPLDLAARREFLAGAIDSDRAALIVAADGDRIVGYLGLQVAGYGVAEFGMCVAAAYRRQGVGSALVGAAIDTSRRLGAHKIACQVWPHNAGARRLYRRLGFVEEGRLRRHYRRRNGELWDAVVMGLVLDAEAAGSSFPDDGLEPAGPGPDGEAAGRG